MLDLMTFCHPLEIPNCHNMVLAHYVVGPVSLLSPKKTQDSGRLFQY